MHQKVKDTFSCRNKEKFMLERDIKKGISYRGVEKLYEDKGLLDDLRDSIDSACSLSCQAELHNTTSTLLAKAIVNGPYYENEVKQLNLWRRFQRGDEITAPEDIKLKKFFDFAHAAVKTGDDDLTGYQTNDSQSNEKMHRAGDKAEVEIETLLKKAKIKYKTQDDQRRASDCATKTPDFLFTEVHYIFGKKVKWIEVKNCFIIPGVTPDKMQREFKSQVESYVNDHGHGAVYWHVNFASELNINGVSNFRKNSAQPITLSLDDDIEMTGAPHMSLYPHHFVEDQSFEPSTFSSNFSSMFSGASASFYFQHSLLRPYGLSETRTSKPSLSKEELRELRTKRFDPNNNPVDTTGGDYSDT